MNAMPRLSDETVTFSKTVSESDVYLFAGLSGDFAANHVNQAFMEKSAYGTRIAHGAMMLAFVSAASTRLVERFPADPAMVPVNLGYDRIRFLEAVRIGDTITVTYRVRDTARSASVRPASPRSPTRRGRWSAWSRTF